MFHRAIAQSGSAFNPWGLGPRNTAEKIANILNVKFNNRQEMANKLREIDAHELMKAQLKFAPVNYLILLLKYVFLLLFVFSHTLYMMNYQLVLYGKVT